MAEKDFWDWFGFGLDAWGKFQQGEANATAFEYQANQARFEGQFQEANSRAIAALLRQQSAFEGYQAQETATLHARNAEWRRFQAQKAIEAGLEAEQAHRKQVKDFKGKQIVGFANNNILLEDEGSVKRILDDTEIYGEMDALAIRKEAGYTALGFQREADNLDRQASLTSTAGAFTTWALDYEAELALWEGQVARTAGDAGYGIATYSAGRARTQSYVNMATSAFDFFRK